MQPAAEKLLQRYEDFLEYANLFAILIKNRVPLFPCGMKDTHYFPNMQKSGVFF